MMFYSRLCAVMTVLGVIVDIIASKKAPGNALGKTRILSEIRDIYRNKISTDQPFNLTNDEIGIRLSPMKGNLLEFHFSFTGVEGSSYSGGIYHGRILLHPDYPRKAPAISVLTPTGRWECGKDICLSATAHHQETWDPNWNLRTLVMALRGHILTQPREIGGIQTSAEHQQKLAVLSRDWICPTCGVDHACLIPGAGGSKTQFDFTGTFDSSENVAISLPQLKYLVQRKKIKELNLVKSNYQRLKLSKSVRRKEQRLKIIQRLLFSFLIGFSVLFFQFWTWSMTAQSPPNGGKAYDSKTPVW